MKKYIITTVLAGWISATALITNGQPALPPTVPGEIPPAPGVFSGTTAGAETEATTITVSRTFTNDANAITIIGNVNSEQEKQDIAAKVQEAAPGKMVNNQLTVAGQSIFEPAGAERDKDKQELDDDSTSPDDESDVPEDDSDDTTDDTSVEDEP